MHDAKKSREERDSGEKRPSRPPRHDREEGHHLRGREWDAPYDEATPRDFDEDAITKGAELEIGQRVRDFDRARKA